MTFQSPLKWPDGWTRGQSRPPSSSGRFKTTFDRSKQRMYRALEKLGATSIVVSSFMPLRLDGTPRADQARRSMTDNGVAVYFTLKQKQMVLARDAYDSAFDNFHSICMALEYLQGLERHGGATMMERAFDGFTALPSQAHWRHVLGFASDERLTLRQVEDRYREGAKRCHSDTGGGHEAMIKLNAAIEQARKELES